MLWLLIYFFMICFLISLMLVESKYLNCYTRKQICYVSLDSDKFYSNNLIYSIGYLLEQISAFKFLLNSFLPWNTFNLCRLYCIFYAIFFLYSFELKTCILLDCKTITILRKIVLKFLKRIILCQFIDNLLSLN